jgi:GalNAc-alpha-(1->4)-GalNAc-alpha-(1->3)-diNAcBac-PP-undecaprenol alpha-1,4-N-acetyl-D-galactosaminyltransferase
VSGARARPRRILLVIHSLTAGGAERVLSLLANAWAARGDHVTIATLSAGGDRPFFALDPAVERLALGIDGNPGPLLSALGAAGRNVSRLRAIRRAIRAARPDVIMSFMNVTNVLTIVAARGTGVPVVATEHIDPSQDDIGALWTTLRRLTYPHVGRLAVLNERVLEYFPPHIRARSVVVPNPVVAPGPAAAPPPSRAPGAAKTLLAMGRMTGQKGFDLLLEAFARVAGRHPDWTLEIWGEGPLRDDLEAQARALGLGARVRLPGRTGDAYGVLAAADLYVLSSRFEGFPMVLCEAMASGLPVVSFDCRTGPREIVRDGVDGVLVPPGDVAALAAALDALMGDPARRARLAARAPEIAERFGMARVLALWDDVFRALGR